MNAGYANETPSITCLRESHAVLLTSVIISCLGQLVKTHENSHPSMQAHKPAPSNAGNAENLNFALSVGSSEIVITLT